MDIYLYVNYYDIILLNKNINNFLFIFNIIGFHYISINLVHQKSKFNYQMII